VRDELELRLAGVDVHVVRGATVRPAQQEPSQSSGVLEWEEPQGRPRALAAGHLDPQLGQADDAGQERLGDVDALDAVVGDAPRRLLQDAAGDAQLGAVDEVAGEPPREKPEPDAQNQAAADPHEHVEPDRQAVLAVAAGEQLPEHGRHGQAGPDHSLDEPGQRMGAAPDQLDLRHRWPGVELPFSRPWSGTPAGRIRFRHRATLRAR
jgi:hypothetical protein